MWVLVRFVQFGFGSIPISNRNPDCNVIFLLRWTCLALGLEVTVVMAGFLRHRLTEVLDYVKKNADYSVERRDDGLQRQLLITGVFFTQSFATTVETELNMRSVTVSACCPPISLSLEFLFSCQNQGSITKNQLPRHTPPLPFSLLPRHSLFLTPSSSLIPSLHLPSLSVLKSS